MVSFRDRVANCRVLKFWAKLKVAAMRVRQSSKAFFMMLGACYRASARRCLLLLLFDLLLILNKKIRDTFLFSLRLW